MTTTTTASSNDNGEVRGDGEATSPRHNCFNDGIHINNETVSTSPTSSLCHQTTESSSTRTELLHMTYEGNFLFQCTSQVTDVVTTRSLNNNKPGEDSENSESPNSCSAESLYSVCLNQTILHPQGGGQPTDWGWITKNNSFSRPKDHDGDTSEAASEFQLKVTQVSLDRTTGIVTHTGEVSSNNLTDFIQVGDVVCVKVDVDRRTILSECHTAGHVVDAALAKCGLYWKPSKAYHFLDGPYVEYQCPTHAFPAAGAQRTTLLQQLQESFVELLEHDMPTNIQLLAVSDANELCNPRPDEPPLIDLQAWTVPSAPGWVDDDPVVRIVTVGGYSCPCGGTHVRSTGDLQQRQWRITGLKCKGGGKSGTSFVRVKYGMGLPRK